MTLVVAYCQTALLCLLHVIEMKNEILQKKEN